ncbi:MAG: DNA-3-methyladenine glycosylase 2 family protein [Labilithrix sp.]|nr:DNA-3-methyladenine glycosylase 2 family protein [Labilithrix sp.]
MSENGQPRPPADAKKDEVKLDPDACYRALVAHDARFDGAFFVGVKTTGVYCRPVCRARTPRRERCEFFTRAALAERAGFRACFRCRPERAPGHASVDAVSRLVAAAARRIDEGALNDASVEDLASELGASARHLRRAMQDELGLGPIELALSKRIGLARELLLGTSLSITEVAFASGFASVRRFNAAYRAHQRMTPSEVRRPGGARAESHGALRVVLDARPPFDASLAFAFLRARAVVGAESFSGETYLRAVSMNGRTGIVAITPARGRDAVVVEVSSSLAPSLMTIAARVRRVFDSDADPQRIGAHLARDPLLRARVRARPALRVVGAFDPFEWAVRAVLGQQVSVRAALTMAGRLVAKLGVPVEDAAREGAPALAWPDAARLADASEGEIASIGLTRARARTVRALARAIADGSLVLDRGADPTSTREALLALPGIGPWTAEYVEMRALGWPDAFPAGDLGLRKALGGISTAECEARAERWRPWRAYAAAHLWTGLSEETG